MQIKIHQSLFIVPIAIVFSLTSCAQRDTYTRIQRTNDTSEIKRQKARFENNVTQSRAVDIDWGKVVVGATLVAGSVYIAKQSADSGTSFNANPVNSLLNEKRSQQSNNNNTITYQYAPPATAERNDTASNTIRDTNTLTTIRSSSQTSVIQNSQNDPNIETKEKEPTLSYAEKKAIEQEQQKEACKALNNSDGKHCQSEKIAVCYMNVGNGWICAGNSQHTSPGNYQGEEGLVKVLGYAGCDKPRYKEELGDGFYGFLCGESMVTYDRSLEKIKQGIARVPNADGVKMNKAISEIFLNKRQLYYCSSPATRYTCEVIR